MKIVSIRRLNKTSETENLRITIAVYGMIDLRANGYSANLNRRNQSYPVLNLPLSKTTLPPVVPTEGRGGLTGLLRFSVNLSLILVE